MNNYSIEYKTLKTQLSNEATEVSIAVGVCRCSIQRIL